MSGRVDRISLEQVVARSRCVVAARIAEPSRRVKKIGIGRGHPAFVWTYHRFTVEEILFAGEEAPAPGKTIDVSAADAGYNLGMHRKRYLEGVSKIALWECYEPEDPENPAKLLFLARAEKGWRFAADCGVEGARLRPRVENLIRKREAP